MTVDDLLFYYVDDYIEIYSIEEEENEELIRYILNCNIFIYNEDCEEVEL